MIYTMPVKFFVGDLLTRLFFAYVFVGMLLFAGGVFYFNNTGAEITEWIYHPLAPYVTGAAVTLLLAPIVVGGIRRIRRGVLTLTIDSETSRIVFGSVRRSEWRQIDHDYAFTDIGQIEVLRNYESRPNARRTGTVAVDSYELNLYFHTDDTWIGVTESRDRPQMQWEAKRISQLTRVPVTERNAPEMVGRGTTGTSDAIDRDATAHPPSAPPFLSENEREVVHRLEVKPGKLRAKLFPFHFQIADQPGQHLASLLMPVVSHFVNKVPYGKSLAAVRYLSADRDASETDRQTLVAELHQAGWRGERELVETVARVFDAHAGIGADRALIEDRAGRYYLWLGDRVRGLSWKYRINFFDVLERVIKDAPRRFAKYQQAPETLLKLQLSEAHSLKFILDVAAVVICGFAAWFSIISIRAGVGWGEPAVLAKGFVAALVTVTLIVCWQVLRRKLGRPTRRPE